MNSPEKQNSCKVESRIDGLHAGKEIAFVFPTDEGRTLWRAYANPERGLHIWSDFYGDEVRKRYSLYGPDQLISSDEYQQRKAAVLAREPDDAPYWADRVEYRGVATREQVVTMLSDWLDEHGNDEVYPKRELGEYGSGGVLETGNGSVYVTGEGAAIFASHIAAMQKRGARFTQF